MQRGLKKTIIGLSITLIASLQITQAGTPQPGDDWLHIDGNKLVDLQGNEVWLTGTNWFGFNTTERIFHGLWSISLEQTMAAMADRGINLIRVPISTELLLEWKNGIYKPIEINTETNPSLANANSLQIFDAALALAKQYGIKILLDVHSAEADNAGHFAPMWYTNNISTQDFYDGWAWVAARYANDDTIIAFDLENEPHGEPWGGSDFAKWDNSTDINNWKHACETAANYVLDENPNMLVMCEGISSFPKDGVTWTSNNYNDYHNNWWGGNLRGVKNYPVNLGARQNQLMYSPHDYGPSVANQPWFYSGFSKETLYQDVWRDNWFYIYEDNIAPLLIGEWGGFLDGGANQQWMYAMRDFIVEHKLHHTFWCLNPNSGDTGGLLNNDWTTWDEAKYALLKPSLWADANGKFIGLDHQVTLGANGTNVAEYYGATAPSVIITAPANNSEVMTGSDVTLHYTLNNTASVNVYINNNLHTVSASTTQVMIAVPTVEGSFTVRLVGVDSNGNEMSVEDSLTLYAIDEATVDPAITLNTPLPGASVTANANISVSVSLQDAAGFQVNLNGSTATFSGTSGNVTAPSSAGSYTLTVSALDSSGNSLGVSDTVSIVVTEPTASAVTCTIGTINSWNSGFVINSIVVANTGSQAITNWTVALEFSQSVTLSNGWSGVFSQQGQTIYVSNVAYNGNLANGQSASFGMQGGISSTLITPTCTVQ